uniref:Putative secreted protein n=1 Tax=Amblyomma triste TaxID=251400 RepID=A0A023FZP2_AMBTT
MVSALLASICLLPGVVLALTRLWTCIFSRYFTLPLETVETDYTTVKGTSAPIIICSFEPPFYRDAKLSPY